MIWMEITMNDTANFVQQGTEMEQSRSRLAAMLKMTRQKMTSYTQKEVARATGLSSQSLSNWEIGLTKPKPEQLAKLALCYGVTTDYLLGIESPAEKAFKASPREIELIDMLRHLSPDDVEDICALAKIKFSRIAAKKLLTEGV